MFTKVTLILLSSCVLVACGGGGGGGTSNPSTPAKSSNAPSSTPASSSSANMSSSSSSVAAVVLQGQFKDTNIAGVRFVSGAQSGTTNATGTFSYEQGASITFSIGGITLGTTTGKAVITPIDLIGNGSADHVAVQNMVRFLLMLDTDGYAQNGIQISSTVQTAATSWTQIDFNSANFSTDVTSIMMAATAADGGSHSLPDIATAQQHMESTHFCIYSGAYKGTFTGTNNGTLGIIADALNGNVSGFVYNETSSELIALSNITPIKHTQAVSFVSGDDTNTLTGEFSSPGNISGTWKKGAENTAFTGTRLTGAANSVYRFTASYTGTDSGLFTFDIDQNNKVTGSSYNVKSNADSSISGTLVGTKLSATTSNIKLQGLLSIESGTLSGTWSDSTKGTSGTFSGSGCQLNPIPLSIDGFRSFKTGRDTGTVQLIPASGTDPLILLDGSPVVKVRMNVNPWGEMSFPINGFDQTGEAAQVDLTGSGFIDITYQSNQSVNLQLRQYAVHGGTHNQITLPAAATFTRVRIPFSDFKGGLSALDLTKVAKFNFALLSNNANDGYAELIVKHLRIENFN
jgi:hypothetical protein